MFFFFLNFFYIAPVHEALRATCSGVGRWNSILAALRGYCKLPNQPPGFWGISRNAAPPDALVFKSGVRRRGENHIKNPIKRSAGSLVSMSQPRKTTIPSGYLNMSAVIRSKMSP